MIKPKLKSTLKLNPISLLPLHPSRLSRTVIEPPSPCTLSLASLSHHPNLTRVHSFIPIELLRVPDGGQQIIDSVDVTCGLSLGEYCKSNSVGNFAFSKVAFFSKSALNYTLAPYRFVVVQKKHTTKIVFCLYE